MSTGAVIVKSARGVCIYGHELNAALHYQNMYFPTTVINDVENFEDEVIKKFRVEEIFEELGA